MVEPIKLVIGFDQRESVAYHTFCQSIIEHASAPLTFMPLAINSLKEYKEVTSFEVTSLFLEYVR